jgi:dTDP-4-dehydrorhamnose 3,5-epimerase-like enzyme
MTGHKVTLAEGLNPLIINERMLADEPAVASTENMEPKIRILELVDGGDFRGSSFTVPAAALEFLKRVADTHLASTRSGAVRGNHYHLRRREAIVILPGAAWSLHWDEGEDTPPQHRQFDGASAVLVLVSPRGSHAVRNDGKELLWLVAMSSEAYDPAETVARKVV